jgi:hypothetical protein
MRSASLDGKIHKENRNESEEGRRRRRVKWKFACRASNTCSAPGWLHQGERVHGSTALAAEVAGKGWFFTLEPPAGSSRGFVAEVGPVPSITALAYPLCVVWSGGQPARKQQPIQSIDPRLL